MKRFALFFVLVLFSFTLITSASAAEEQTQHRLESLGLTISIPNDWITVSVEEEVPSEDLSVLGLKSENLVTALQEKHIYINAVNVTPLSEILLSSQESESSKTIFDFSRYTDEELLQVAKEMISEDTQSTYSNPRIVAHPQAHFVGFDVQQVQGDKTIHGIQYYTVINGRTISLTLNNYSGEITDKQKEILDGVAASLVFDEVKPIPSGPTLWMILVGAAILLVVVTVVYFFIIRRKRTATPKRISRR